MNIYLAGPDVFLPDAIEAGRRKKALCARHGFVGLYPLDQPSLPPDVRPDLGIYRANIAMIRRADAGVFNLTPFRGLSADPGTVFELGLLVGLGKPVLGYTNEATDLNVRVGRDRELAFDAASFQWRDADGMAVEDFGNADNLMIDAALFDAGFPIVRQVTPPADRFRDLTGFETCLRLLSARLLPAGRAAE